VAFSDPIVGTEVLIRNQIQSENFSVDPETGVTGWQIKRDGTATFNQLVIGSPFFNIDANGDAVFHSITLTADDTETAIFIHGEDIDPELYNLKARGIVEYVDLTNSSATTTSTSDNIVGRMVLADYDVDRMYKFIGLLHLDCQSATPTYIGIRVRYAWDADPTTSSSILFEHQMGGREAATGTDEFFPIAYAFDDAELGTVGTDLRLLVSVFAQETGLRVQSETWNYIAIEDAGEKIPHSTYDMSGGGGSPPTQYVKTYSANGSASYQGDDDERAGIAECYQGQYSSTNGNQYSVILFPYSTIATDLSGATINKVEVYLNNNHWYNNSGGTAVIGYHNSATTPSSFTYPSSTDNVTQSSFTYGQAKWVTVDNSIGTAFKNGTAKGILLGKGQTAGGTLSTSKTYYGYFAGNGQSGEPQLRITYTK
jgi:hypothetical protein